MRDGATLPDWPGAMKRMRAASYMDMAVSSFDAAVKAKEAPQPVMVPKGGPRWRREDLDAWLRDLAEAAAEQPASNEWDDA